MKIATILILLHTPGGVQVWINPQMVTNLHARSDDRPNKHLTEGVECLIAMADGKFVSVVERCDEVRKMMEESK